MILASNGIIPPKEWECDKFIKYVAVILRGNEIKVLPESIQYNIFMAK